MPKLPNVDWPLDSNVIRGNVKNNAFGNVRTGNDGKPRPHQGWDLKASIGTPCFAIADGTIELVKTAGDYGNQIVQNFVANGGTLHAFYAHLSQIAVGQGDKVRKGQQIGLTGDSGNAKTLSLANKHLHFEIRTVAVPGPGLQRHVDPETIFGQTPIATAVARGA